MPLARLIDRRSLAAPLVLGLILTPPALAELGTISPNPPDPAPAESFPSSAPNLDSLDLGPLGLDTLEPTLLAPPNIGGGIWLAKGPGPAIYGQVEAILPGPDEVVGAVHTLAAHPTNPDILYAGGVNGGIWKTTNATSTGPRWTPLTDFETSLAIGALEFDPTDASDSTLVAGVGRYSSFGRYGGARTGNLLKTTDGGATWASLAGLIGAASSAGVSGVAPRGSTIVASSNTSDAYSCSDIGIWRSTDGGASFTHLLPLGVAFDLAGDPAVPGTLYTAMTYVSWCSGSGTNGVYRSTDTGLTWTKVSSTAMDALIVDGTTNNVEIAVNGPDVFVDIIQSGRPVGIFHSPDGGATWAAMDLPRTPEGSPLPIGLVTPGTPVTIDTSPSAHGLFGLKEEVEITGVTGPAINGVWTTTVTSSTTFTLDNSSDATPWTPGTGTWVKVVGLSPKEKPGSQGSIHASIRSDPIIGTTVYVGGDRQDWPFPNFLGAQDYSGRLFRGDVTVPPAGAIPSPQWEHLTHLIGPPTPGGGTLSGSAPHADSREMVVDADGDLIEGDDGGIYRRTNPTSNAGDWFSIIGNLQVTEQHDIAYDAISDIIISGNQDTGTTEQLTTNGLTWDSIHTADGGDVAIDDLTVPGVSTRYSSYQNLGSFRRREYDATNNLLSQVFPTLTPLGGVSLGRHFVTPVELNTVVPTSLIIGGYNAVFESFDQGDTITDIPVSNPAHCTAISFPQNAMAYGGWRGGAPDVDAIWVGSGSSVCRRLAAPGALLLETPTVFPGGTVTDIVLDPTDTWTAYVTDATDVYQTHDAGTTWTKMTGNLTDTRLGSAVIDPVGLRLFVGGREGVSVISLPPPGVAAGGPFVWGRIGIGLPNAPVWDMEWDVTDGVLVVGTLGRGAWVLQEDGACGKPDKLVVNNKWVTGTQLDEACTQITGGPSLDVTATGDLRFKSPLIVLTDGFSVKSGGKFVAEIGAP